VIISSISEKPDKRRSGGLLVWLLFITFVMLYVLPLEAQTGQWGTGLEVVDYRNVPLVIEHLPGEAERIRLRDARIRTRAELRLRTAGLRPVSHEGAHFLYIKVNVVERAFQVTLEFKRPVSYAVTDDRTYTKIGVVWDADVTGTHANDPEYIISTLDTLLDRFINEYLGANDTD